MMICSVGSLGDQQELFDLVKLPNIRISALFENATLLVSH